MYACVFVFIKGGTSSFDRIHQLFVSSLDFRNVDHFEYLNRIEEGTYGVVFRARDKRTNEHVALKKLKMEKEKQGFPITSLREINTLLKVKVGANCSISRMIAAYEIIFVLLVLITVGFIISFSKLGGWPLVIAIRHSSQIIFEFERMSNQFRHSVKTSGPT
jgi:serine/threonine protein kinase